VFAAKSRAGLWSGRIVDLGRVSAVVGTGGHEALADEVAQRSLVLVRDTLGLVPLPAAELEATRAASSGGRATTV